MEPSPLLGNRQLVEQLGRLEHSVTGLPADMMGPKSQTSGLKDLERVWGSSLQGTTSNPGWKSAHFWTNSIGDIEGWEVGPSLAWGKCV